MMTDNATIERPADVPFWKLRQLADHLGVSKPTLRKLAAQNRFRTINVGVQTLVPMDEVRRVLNEGI
jgi:excisionase family DNA binding protein